MHTQFLDDCLKECLLMDQKLFMTLNNIISYCLYFSETIENSMKSFNLEDSYLRQVFLDENKRNKTSDKRKAKSRENSNIAEKLLAKNRYIHMIEGYSNKFDEYLSTFLVTINSNRSRSETHLINLIIRLDYNNYYSEKGMLDEKSKLE